MSSRALVGSSAIIREGPILGATISYLVFIKLIEKNIVKINTV